MSEAATSAGEDVNTDAGFNAFLAEQAGGELTPEAREALESGEPTVERGLEVIEESPGERKRDPDTGRFLPRDESGEGAPPPAAEGAPPADESGEQQPAPEPAPQQIDWEARYKEVEKTLGRVAQEQGEKIANLQGQLEAVQRGQQAQPQTEAQLPTGDAAEDYFVNRIDKEGGPALMEWVLTNAPSRFEEALDLWSEEQPGRAALWASFYGAGIAAQEQGKDQQPPAEQSQYLTRVETREMLQETVAEAVKGLSAEDKKLIAPHFESASSEAPEFVKKAYVSQDPAERLDAAKWILGAARVKAVEHATAQARAANTEQTIAAKRAAMVATGSLRPVEGGHSGKEELNLEGLSPEEKTKAITDAFHKQLFATETTSVYDGLTTK